MRDLILLAGLANCGKNYGIINKPVRKFLSLDDVFWLLGQDSSVITSINGTSSSGVLIGFTW